MTLKKDIRQLLHGVSLTQEQRQAHEEAGESFHNPVIVHRSGGVSATKLNACGICGVYIRPAEVEGYWVAISNEEADAIRAKHDSDYKKKNIVS